MTNPELSDMFTSMLNSYNTQANFGEEASKRDIVLDEYEKSVYLTQAQDIVVKSYFDRTLNSQAQGFDDSTRRQVDFSNLIKVVTLEPSEDNSSAFDPRGIIYNMPKKEGTEVTDVLFILNEKLIAKTVVYPEVPQHQATVYTDAASDTEGAVKVVDSSEPSDYEVSVSDFDYLRKNKVYKDGSSNPKAGDWLKVTGTITVDKIDTLYDNNGFGKEYVIVPINYKEYDREMSKPYAQPLKKQAWRLFQNLGTGFDVHSELIPKWNIRVAGYSDGEEELVVGDMQLLYKIRYVKRPNPIILEDLPNELSIDGESSYSECELNPILHIDILNKAVELAITTRGGAAAERGQFPANNMRGNNN